MTEYGLVVYRPEALTLSVAGVDRVDSLQELWLALHRHHRATANLQPVVDDSTSWRLRRNLYIDRLEANTAFLVVASIDDRSVGYAMVLVEAGPDDTWPLGNRYAELYSLSVAPELRRRGIGTRLLDFVDQELNRRGIHDLRVAVMVGNGDAQRLYERRGLVPAEVVLYRLAASSIKESAPTDVS
ncbi:MAG TPA: GNAT family N-acetyltransferase, partial [Candidatus Dormibacteraeota bacterium]|jgi:ribosomal protein S18 acetylase RimI-like enzyme|nr:GNAT family N-acetyltransferase [Candidatus Dormibacteraeota bacterium]